MKRERQREIELVEEIITKYFFFQQGVLNQGGGRFKKVDEIYDRRGGESNFISRTSENKIGGEEIVIQEGGFHNDEARDTSLRDTNDEDFDAFLDTKVY